MQSGDLAQAVRASVAVPLLFAPEQRDGRFLADGGLSANIPVAVARARGRRAGHRGRTPPSIRAIRSICLLAARRGRPAAQFLFQQPADSLRRRRPPHPARTSTASPVSTSPAATSSACSSAASRAADTVLPRPRLPRGAGAASHRGCPRGSRGRHASTAPTHPSAWRSPRLLGLDVGGRDTLDFDLLLQRVRSLATTSEAYESVWLSPDGRRAIRCSFDLALAPRGSAGRRPRPRLRQRARRDGCGRAWWTDGFSTRAAKGARRSSSASFVESSRWVSGATTRSAGSSSTPLSPSGSPTRTSGASTGEGEEVDQAETREAVGLRGHRAGARRRVGPGARGRRQDVG